MKKKFLILICFSLFYTATSAKECWIVKNLKGKNVNKFESYNFTDDQYSDKYGYGTFKIVLDGNNSSVNDNLNGYENFSCISYGQAMNCISNKSQYGFSQELWNVDVVAKKVIYLKQTVGFGGFNGAKLFVGDLIESCNN